MKVGIIGGGQLGLMLGAAGQPLGISARFLEPAHDPCAARAGAVLKAAYDDPAALEELARSCDAMTYEFENVPLQAIRALSERFPVFPPPRALEVSQDRLAEKRFFQDLGVPVAAFSPVSSMSQLLAAIDLLGLPAILKTRRMGYDGKGQLYLADPAQAERAYATLDSEPCILERVVPFDRELSVVAVRSRGGEIAVWPVVENRHAGGILRWSIAPAPETRGIPSAVLQARAEEIARAVLSALDYVGVVAIELFQMGERLVANEMAPRVHNSGHWSIEGSFTSQFENHLRAVLGLPLGRTDAPLPVGCVNLLGSIPPIQALLSVPGASVHLYGKEPRPGRKLGHVTLRGADLSEVQRGIERVRSIIEGP